MNVACSCAQAFKGTDVMLARPDIRAKMEKQVALIADGAADMQPACTLPAPRGSD